MKASKILASVNRRDLFRLTGTFGLSSVVMGAATLAGTGGFASLAQATESTYKKRFGKTAKHTLKLGAAGLSPENLLIERAGVLEFARDLEERTDGEIRVEFLGDNTACTQLNCAEKTMAGELDLYTSSTQNSAGAAPYLNVLDFAYMFPSRAAQYYFLYSPASQKILRDPLEKRHGLKFLFSQCELRGIQLGKTFEDKPPVTRIEDLFGTKNRTAGSELGKIAMNLLHLNPLPIAWEETLEGLEVGLLDGIETWASAVAYANMAPLITQSVDLKFFCGTEHTAINAKVFDSLEGPLQDAVMESSYLAQVHVQAANEAALVNSVGFSDPPLSGTIFEKDNVKPCFLIESEIKKAEEMCSPKHNPEPWAEWRERISIWAGGIDTYKEIYEVAREIPKDMLAENVEPRRWWRSQ